MTIHISGFAEVEALAARHGLTMRKACLFKGKGGWGYMFDRNGRGEHWCHTLKQGREYLKAIGGES